MVFFGGFLFSVYRGGTKFLPSFFCVKYNIYCLNNKILYLGHIVLICVCIIIVPLAICYLIELISKFLAEKYGETQ